MTARKPKAEEQLVERLAPHDATASPPLQGADKVLVQAVGHAICAKLYQGRCACERRRLSLCSSVEAAAEAVIKIVRPGA